jgi:apolipoprotein N-acyltransferase
MQGPVWGVPATRSPAVWGFSSALAQCSHAALDQGVRRIAVFAAAFFVPEWLRGNILTGLRGSSCVCGLRQAISQLASIVGAYGLTLLALLVSAAPAARDRGQSSAPSFAPMLAATLAIGMAWGGALSVAASPLIRLAHSRSFVLLTRVW